MMEYIITDERLSEIIHHNDVVVLSFIASWAMPAHKQIAELKELTETHNKVKFISVDVDACDELSKKYKIRSVPSLLFFKDSKIVWTKVGLLSKEAISDFLNKIHLLAFL